MQPQQQHMGGQQTAPIQQPVAATYHQQAQSAQPQLPTATDPMAQFRHLLGNAMVPDILGPQEDDLKSVLFELQLDGSLVKSFCDAYKEHCEEILNAVMSLQLNDVEHIWLRFWQVSISTNGDPVYTNSAGTYIGKYGFVFELEFIYTMLLYYFSGTAFLNNRALVSPIMTTSIPLVDAPPRKENPNLAEVYIQYSAIKRFV